MGNCALLTFTAPPRPTGSTPVPALYLHWNGGPESVFGFVAAVMEHYGDCRPCHDMQAFAARMVGAACTYLGTRDGLSAYLTAVPYKATHPDGDRVAANREDPGGNGIYAFCGVKVYRFVNGRWLTDEERDAERNAAIDDPQYAAVRDAVLTRLRTMVAIENSELVKGEA